MSQISNKRLTGLQSRIPGRGFLKNFFKVHGPVRTIKGSVLLLLQSTKAQKATS